MFQRAVDCTPHWPHGSRQHAVAVALDDVAGWGVMLTEALRQTGGPLSDDERAWADDVLGTGTRPAA